MKPNPSSLALALLALASTLGTSASAQTPAAGAAPSPNAAEGAAPPAPNPPAPAAPSAPAAAPTTAAAPGTAAAPAPAPASTPAPAPAATPDAAAAPAAAPEGATAPSSDPATAAAPAVPSNPAAPVAAAPVVAAPVVAAPAPASAATSYYPPTDSGERPAPRDIPAIDASLGLHVAFVSNSRFDLFSDDDALPSFAAGAGVTLVDLGAAHLALTGSALFGGVEARVRGQRSDLTVTRLELGPELRFPLVSSLYAYGRLSPIAAHVDAELSDSSSGSVLSQSAWQFGADAAAGLSFRFAAARPRQLGHAFGFHLRLEAGYAALSSTALDLEPGGDGAPIRSEPLAFGDLSLSGLQFRTALAFAY